MNKTGERLNHILDLIGFRAGRGRIPGFQSYINQKQIKDVSTLKYSTVRSWFNDCAPPMKKINLIVNALAEDYRFDSDLHQIKVWWKLGGIYPFKIALVLKDEDTNDDKLNFLITSMVTDESGENFKNLSSSSLIAVKNKAINLAKDFADPNKIEIPHDYLRFFIAKELSKNSV